MSNTSKAIKDIGELVSVWGGFIHHDTYRDICYDLAWLVELSDGDITDEQYTEWWNENISRHVEN